MLPGLALTTLYFLCLHNVESFPTTHKRQYVLLTSGKTNWNDINKHCKDNHNGHIFTMHDESVEKVINRYKSSSPWSSSWGEDIWLGMYMTDHSKKDYTWLGECSSSSPIFVKWECGNNCDPTLDHEKLCAKAKKDELVWDFEKCSIDYNGICEEITGDCSFEQHPSAGCIQHSSNKDYLSVTSEVACQDLCTTEINSNRECWVTTYDPNSQICTLSFDDDPFKFDSNKSPFTTCNNAGDRVVSWKRCFEPAATDSRNIRSNSYENELEAQMTCTNTPQQVPTTTPPTTTTPVETTTTPPTTTTPVETTTTTSTSEPTTELLTTTTSTTESTTTTETSGDSFNPTTQPQSITTTTDTSQTLSETELPTTTAETSTSTTTTTGFSNSAELAETTTNPSLITLTGTNTATTGTSFTTTNTTGLGQNSTTTPSTSSADDSNLSTTTATSETPTSAVMSQTTAKGDNSTCETTDPNLVCTCSCYDNFNISLMQAAIDELKRELLVSKKGTSLYRRSLTSAPDDRPSAVGIGMTLGVAVIVLVIFSLTVGDAVTFIRWVAKAIKKNKIEASEI